MSQPIQMRESAVFFYILFYVFLVSLLLSLCTFLAPFSREVPLDILNLSGDQMLLVHVAFTFFGYILAYMASCHLLYKYIADGITAKSPMFSYVLALGCIAIYVSFLIFSGEFLLPFLNFVVTFCLCFLGFRLFYGKVYKKEQLEGLKKEVHENYTKCTTLLSFNMDQKLFDACKSMIDKAFNENDVKELEVLNNNFKKYIQLHDSCVQLKQEFEQL
tara:strand:- start:169876 stop:170526 length:651 start_codon:yes stop_codon:yes gene_type:complete